MTKRLDSIEQVCGRMETALAALHAAVQKKADLPRPSEALRVRDEGTQTAPAANLHAAKFAIGTQTSSSLMSSKEHCSGPARMHNAAEQIQATPTPWQRRTRASAGASRGDAEQPGHVQAKRARMEPQAAPKNRAPDAAAQTQPVQRGDPPAAATCTVACAAAAMPQASPWRTKASADPFMQAAARPAGMPDKAADVGASQSMQDIKGQAVIERPRPRLPPANMAYARLSPPQQAEAATKVCCYTAGAWHATRHIMNPAYHGWHGPVRSRP